MRDLIFGYTWEEIQAAQQGKPLGKFVDTSKPVQVPALTENDLQLYREHGIQGLKELGYDGVLDRLERSEYDIS